MTHLTALANQYETDKGTVVRAGHGYSLLYDLILGPRRRDPLNLLEIGLCAADDKAEMPSVSMWRAYFPKAQVYGVDIADFSRFEGDGFRFKQADCGDPAQLAKLKDWGVGFDLIIDDGSHASFHQQLTMRETFPLLNRGGLYIIEDLHLQPALPTPKVQRTDLVLNEFIATSRFPEGLLSGLESEIDSILLFDDQWFYHHRRQVNRREGLEPEFRSHQDRFTNRAALSVGAFKRLIGRLRSELEGPDALHRRPRIKLAVIRKKAA